MSSCEPGTIVIKPVEINADKEDEELAAGDGEVKNGERAARKMQDPKRPTAKEIAQHLLTHLPYRSWCLHCVRGRGLELPHARGKELPTIPEVHFDFCFPGDDGEPGRTLTVFAGRDRQTRMTLAAVVPTKSSTGSFIARRVVAFLREIGMSGSDITIKSDQEPAMISILNEVARMRAAEGGGRTMLEHSPVDSSQSNGVIERGILSVEQMVRVLRSGFEERIGYKLEPKHPIMTWLIEYAGFF